MVWDRGTTRAYIAAGRRRTKGGQRFYDAKRAYHYSQRPSHRISVSTYRPRNVDPVFYKKTKAVLNSVAEKKYYDLTATSQSFDSSGTIADLTAVPQNTGAVTDSNREGDQIYVKSLQLRGYVTVADSSNLVRVILFQWKIDTAVAGSAPSVTNILQGTGIGIGPISMFNHDGARNYRILYDRLFVRDTDDPVVSFNTIVTKGMRRKIQYSGGGTGGINKIYILIISDSNAASHPTVTYYTRLNYLDM